MRRTHGRPEKNALFDTTDYLQGAQNEKQGRVIGSDDLTTSQQIRGYPMGSGQDIVSLSDAPVFTAFPNPFLREWFPESVEKAEPLYSGPFAADVSEGKNDPYYSTFNYHTKVPPLAIAKYILHYTRPGEVVADFFCGSGMTGLAAQLCGVESEGPSSPREKFGARQCLLTDLSPVATYLSFAFTRSVDGEELKSVAHEILAEAEEELGWLYRLPDSGATIDYVVWSDVLVCPSCSQEFSYYEGAIEPATLDERSKILCPHCEATTTMNESERAIELVYDPIVNKPLPQVKERPITLYAQQMNRRIDLDPETAAPAIERAREAASWLPVPMAKLPEGFNTRQPRESHKIEYVHQFYTWRNLVALAWLHSRIEKAPQHLRPFLTVIVLSLHARASKRNRNIPKYGHRHVGVLSGTLYVPPLREETNQFRAFKRRVDKAASSIGSRKLPDICRISTQSATDLSNVPDECIEYIFVDPPFGSNIMYSELNFLWEAWLGVYTNNEDEAIINSVQHKGLSEYQDLMLASFTEFHRVLRPGRWMTVEFHNSKNSVWTAIQEALQMAGFVVADVRTLDKKKGTIKQLSTSNSAKQDLIISAYRPNEDLERRFELEAGTEGGVWDFVESHLRQLPVVVEKDGAVEPVAERMGYLLFDRMVAFHVQRGVSVPLSAAEFYAGLKQRYPERDGMYFVPDQVAGYDRKRVKARELLELQLFITGESSAIQWLRQELTKKPQTFQELSPEFMKDLGWARHEKSLELDDLLKENFLRHREGEPIPHQLLSWMKQSAKHRPKIAAAEEKPGGIPEIGLTTHDPEMISAARDRWYVPDPNRARDLEKLREAALHKEFETYRQAGGKRLKVFRLEAVRAGFGKAWRERDYETIISVAKKIPETVLQEDAKLLMYYDNALDRTEE